MFLSYWQFLLVIKVLSLETARKVQNETKHIIEDFITGHYICKNDQISSI